MKVLISGASGFIGRQLVPFLQQRGIEVFCLVRSPALHSPAAIYWDPEQGILNPQSLAGMDAIVNLSGENILSLRWTKDKKQRLLASRVAAARLLCQAAALCDNPPKKIFSSSAIGYYGNRGSEILDESALAGTGFLAELCKAWELATQPAKDAEIPVVWLRTGLVLNPQGGALQTMLWPFKLGLGGRIGSGKQYMSWIALEDFMHLLWHLLLQPNVEGAVNFTAPNPVTNADFTKILGHVLQRPTFLTVPEFIVRSLLGEMGEQTLLSSTRALPQKSLATGYSFLYPNLLQALQAML